MSLLELYGFLHNCRMKDSFIPTPIPMRNPFLRTVAKIVKVTTLKNRLQIKQHCLHKTNSSALLNSCNERSFGNVVKLTTQNSFQMAEFYFLTSVTSVSVQCHFRFRSQPLPFQTSVTSV